jgi:hypothetical protein
MNFFQKNRYFFYTKIGILITTISGIFGLAIFIPSTIKEYGRGDNLFVVLDSFYVLLFLYGLCISIIRIVNYNNNKRLKSI